MGDSRWERMWELFHRALELGPDERLAFLREGCAGDGELLTSVENLLASHAEESILDSEAGGVAAAAAVEDPLIGSRIGPYRIVELLGEGGMGMVYAAEQEEPVRRSVALKVIRLGMDTRQVVARFESERQALALMDHPAIARVFDASATENGRPYFVMERVHGAPIADYCDEHRLNTARRLELFLKVCDGVRHAHQRGVIHRDLKPSNVLVTTQDGRPAPKIIDFGVAKAVESRLAERTMFTVAGAWIGTPEYMSPEQADPGLGIDTRTDVYALGVLLYELLVGALPFDPEALRGAGFDEIRRKIREEEPSRPSLRISSLGGDRPAEAAGRRGTDVPTLRRQLSGDLDWITMKALEKDRERRYGSVAELADDIGRHLGHEPVRARPPSALYRGRKFLRRHRVGVAICGLSLAFLISLAASMTLQASRIALERDRVSLEAETARQVSDFLIELFEVSDPGEARGNSVTAREILDRGAAEIERTLGDRPEIRARMMHTIGEVYRKLGLFDESARLLEESLAIRTELLGVDHPDTLASQHEYGLTLWDRDDVEQPEAVFRDVLVRRRRVLGQDHPDTLDTMNNVGAMLMERGRLDEAEPYLRETLERRRRVLGDEERDTFVSILSLGQLHLRRGAVEQAEPLLQEVLDTAGRVLGEDHPLWLTAMNDMILVRQRQERYGDAAPLARELLETSRRVRGPDHRETLIAANNLGYNLNKMGRPEEAERYYREAAEGLRRALGEDSPITLLVTGNLGEVCGALGRHDEAERLLGGAAGRARVALPPGHGATGTVLGKYGRYLTARGRFEEAEAALLEAREIFLEAGGSDDPRTRRAAEALAELYRVWGRPERAAELAPND